MLDINELFLRQSLERLGADYPALQFRGIIGDFVEDVDRLGPPGHRLVVFFGGTIGNLYPHERRVFLRKLAAGMDGTDAMLVGVDLVKDPARLEAAYDDPEGVTAAFNRNVLAVLNRRFEANFEPSRFKHRALYDAENAWIEMRLVAKSASHVHIRSLEMDLDLAQGDEIRTEISCKFTRASLASSAAEAGLVIDAWFTDQDALFALALLRKKAS
jgi:L-histidine N-alpha-methyltransferase